MELLKAIYRRKLNIVGTCKVELQQFEMKHGLKQGCLLNSLLFSLPINIATKKAEQKLQPLQSERNLNYNFSVLHEELKNINI